MDNFRFCFGILSYNSYNSYMLTKRQKQILDFVSTKTKKKGYAPSLEEIRKHFKLRSVSSIHQHLEAIKNKG